MGKGLSIGTLVAVCAAGSVLAADRAETVAKPEPIIIRGAELVGRPMKALSLDVDLRYLPAPPEWQPGDPIKDIPRRAYPPETQPPAIVDPIPDPLLAVCCNRTRVRKEQGHGIHHHATCPVAVLPVPPDTAGRPAER